jgi:hypothetical protein
MAQQTTIPEIRVGPWTFGPAEDGSDDPSLSFEDMEFRVGRSLNSAELRKAALDLMKLAAAVQAAGF